jgi:aspartate kinase
MVVVKFGGTAMLQHPYDALSRIMGCWKRNQPVVVVVSAIAGVTNALLDANVAGVRKILKHWQRENHVPTRCFANVREMLSFCDRCSSRASAKNLLVSMGEKISAVLLCAMMAQYSPMRGAPVWADVDVISLRNGEWLCNSANIGRCRDRHLIPVVTGFCARDVITGATRLLGRNGSDTTATLLAKELKEDCVIFSDVPGIMTADPRICKSAVPIRLLTFSEVRELAFHGASVLHGKCVEFAEKNVGRRLIVAHVADCAWRANGTVIASTLDLGEGHENIVAVAVLQHRVGISVRAERGVPGFACSVFQKVCDAGVSVEMFSQTCSETSICLVVPAERQQDVEVALRDFSVTVTEELAIVTVVGEGMQSTPGVAGCVCEQLGDFDINIRSISQGASETSLSVAVSESDALQAVRAVHDIIVTQ